EHTALADTSAPRLTYGTGPRRARSNGSSPPTTVPCSPQRPLPRPGRTTEREKPANNAEVLVECLLDTPKSSGGPLKNRPGPAYSNRARSVRGDCPQVLYTPCG